MGAEERKPAKDRDHTHSKVNSIGGEEELRRDAAPAELGTETKVRRPFQAVLRKTRLRAQHLRERPTELGQLGFDDSGAVGLALVTAVVVLVFDFGGVEGCEWFHFRHGGVAESGFDLLNQLQSGCSFLVRLGENHSGWPRLAALSLPGRRSRRRFWHGESRSNNPLVPMHTGRLQSEPTGAIPVVAKLMEQPGVGTVTATVMRAVIGRFDRFRSGKQLSKYCGVTPCNSSSGKRQADAGLVESGNDILRPMLIQLAKRLPRHEPRWKEFRESLRKTKGANVVSAANARVLHAGYKALG